jgi:ABC-type spermidine/putrescine transport system permease subunit II
LRVRNFVGRKQVFWLLLTPIMMPSVILAVALYYVAEGEVHSACNATPSERR